MGTQGRTHKDHCPGCLESQPGTFVLCESHHSPLQVCVGCCHTPVNRRTCAASTKETKAIKFDTVRQTTRPVKLNKGAANQQLSTRLYLHFTNKASNSTIHRLIPTSQENKFDGSCRSWPEQEAPPRSTFQLPGHKFIHKTTITRKMYSQDSSSSIVDLPPRTAESLHTFLCRRQRDGNMRKNGQRKTYTCVVTASTAKICT